MKTLDEVINKLECYPVSPSTLPYSVSIVTVEDLNEVLHYLKMLKDILDPLKVKKVLHEITCPQCNSKIAILLPESNEPLTWDELKTMQGKPVWVEVLSDEIDLSSRWMLVAMETKAHSLPLAYTDDIGHWIFGHEDKLGKTWQAYRREKE